MCREARRSRSGAGARVGGAAGPVVLVRASTRAMATGITVQLVVEPQLVADPDRALQVFHEVESVCTRFGTDSDLVRLNRAPDRWHRVPRVLLDALVEAHRGHVLTRGAFDPRVLTSLRALGYDRGFRSCVANVALEDRDVRRVHPRGLWRPRFRRATSEVHLRGDPVDLGGIGKGLAVRWAAARLAAQPAVSSYLVEAGGDCFAAGPGPDDGLGWRIAVEDPDGGAEPVAVVRVVDRAVTTSSVRLRTWTVKGRSVHHILDPRTGMPGGAGLLAVTVVGADPAVSEIWSKSLFLAGRAGIASLANRRGLAALWVGDDGAVETSPGMDRYVMWRRT